MNRRSLLGSIIAAAAAPAIVRADSLMRVVPRSTGVLHTYHNNVWLWRPDSREWSLIDLPTDSRQDATLASIEYAATLGVFMWRAGDQPASEAFALVPPDWQDPREGWQRR